LLERQPQPQPQKALLSPPPEPDYEYVKMTQIWKAIVKLGESIEREMSKELADYFFTLRSEVLEKIFQRQGYKAVKASAIEDELIFNMSAAIELLRKNILPYVKEAYEAGIETLDTGGMAYGLTNPRAVAALGKRAKDLEQVNATVAKQLQGGFKPILERGLEEGLSYDSIAGELADSAKNVFNNARSRAKTIAVTEVNGAMNQARFDVMTEIGTPKHRWIHSRRGQARPNHVAIDGEVVIVGQSFSIGLKYPHDIDGGPGETINCHCVTVPVED